MSIIEMSGKLSSTVRKETFSPATNLSYTAVMGFLKATQLHVFTGLYLSTNIT